MSGVNRYEEDYTSADIYLSSSKAYINYNDYAAYMQGQEVYRKPPDPEPKQDMDPSHLAEEIAIVIAKHLQNAPAASREIHADGLMKAFDRINKLPDEQLDITTIEECLAIEAHSLDKAEQKSISLQIADILARNVANQQSSSIQSSVQSFVTETPKDVLEYQLNIVKQSLEHIKQHQGKKKKKKAEQVAYPMQHLLQKSQSQPAPVEVSIGI